MGLSDSAESEMVWWLLSVLAVCSVPASTEATANLLVPQNWCQRAAAVNDGRVEPRNALRNATVRVVYHDSSSMWCTSTEQGVGPRSSATGWQAIVFRSTSDRKCSGYFYDVWMLMAERAGFGIDFVWDPIGDISWTQKALESVKLYDMTADWYVASGGYWLNCALHVVVLEPNRYVDSELRRAKGLGYSHKFYDQSAILVARVLGRERGLWQYMTNHLRPFEFQLWVILHCGLIVQ